MLHRYASTPAEPPEPDRLVVVGFSEEHLAFALRDLLSELAKPEQLLERLKPFAGRRKILQSTMAAENEAILRNLLEGKLSRLQSTSTTPTETKP